MPRQGADRDLVVPKLDGRKAGNAHEIDDDRGTGHPEIQKRHQRLPPGHYLAVAVRRRERPHRSLEAFGDDIVEGRRLHSATPESSDNLTFALPSKRDISVRGTGAPAFR